MMSPAELRAAYARLNREQDQELDRVEVEVSQRFRLRRRELFKGAGEQTALAAELDEAYYDLFPPASNVPDGTPLVEVE